MISGRLVPLGMALVLALSAGCEGRNGGSGFFLPNPSPVPGGGTLVVEGPSTLAPGSSAQFRATLIEPSGVRGDVTGKVSWTIRGFGIEVSQTGLVTARDLGFGTVVAAIGGLVNEVELTAMPPGTHMVRGMVTPVIEAARGRVEVVDGPFAGREARTDLTGHYWLVGVAGPLRLRATLIGHGDETRTLTVADNLRADFALSAPAIRDPTGAWRLSVSTAPGCDFQIRGSTADVDLTRVFAPDGPTWLELTAPDGSGTATLIATLVATVFSGHIGWGDGVDELRDVRLSSPAAGIWGSALGVAGDEEIRGVITGRFFDRGGPEPRSCGGEHPFVMRRK